MSRRRFLQSTLALSSGFWGGAKGLGAALPIALSSSVDGAIPAPREFPKGFLWGAGSSAYQVEGAWNIDGKGESIWDRFAHTSGKVKDGHTGDNACGSYFRYQEDIALLRRMNLKSYRYSISWPRIQPNGRGPANEKGLDYYRRVTDALLEAGVRPMPTLYHWDLPQALEDAGGWPNRDLVGRFTDYASIVANALADRLSHCCIFNEPRIFTWLGYCLGIHAPGHTDPLQYLRATHVVNLAQGAAFRVLKAANPRLQVGSSFDTSPVLPATLSYADVAAAERAHRFNNLWFVDTALYGRYPQGVLPTDRQTELLGIRDGDETLMRASLDFIGLNYYAHSIVKDAPNGVDIPGINFEGQKTASGAYSKTDLGWDIYPQGIYEIVMRMARDTGNLPIEIAENGAAFNVGLGVRGRVNDVQRIIFLQEHLRALAHAIADGAPVRAYHYWSLLDNFEWAYGYTQRFGLVHVNFADLRRTVKDSGAWFAQVAATNQVP